MDVLIVGAGSMGTWFGDAIDASVAFADVDPDAAAAAADRIEDAEVAALEGDDRYDVVCLAVPMTHVEDAVADHAPRARRAVVDVSGVMEPALEAMQNCAADLERLSLHPLFAPERAPGSIAVVRDRDGPATEALLEALEARGNDLVETTPAEHDEAMETVQATTHAAVLAFALAADGSAVPDGFETPIYDRLETLAEQVTDGSPRVYADIQDAFDGADAVAAAAAEIASADGREFEELYREAGERWANDADTPGDADPATDDHADGSDTT
ncbi:prephenate dehydrogenase/arogenate dehydrogenase family protein [Halobiforma nitratireducens]|uniref:Prephenate dehydrogenase n=1 Tax=Halobiforma nitratireducens JCM 10879 TaxID=1227454 RepID=M0LY81_9EURY|nr:prephenate dehydrogenase/arogenate dehydrogenase family protein [Halobiforma nitratireducens]EMA37319.1 prephenate dehydrogenase [Halobiforma nitratireducens JCM 10879]